MTGAEPESATPHLSNSQRLTLAGLWLFALLVIIAQYFGYRQLDHLNGQLSFPEAGHLGPSDRWLFWGWTLPLASITAALVLQCRWTARGWRILATIGLVAMAPIDLLASMTLLLLMVENSSAGTSDGRHFATAPDDHANTFLTEQVGPLGLYSKIVDMPLMGPRARLRVSRDDKWLVIVDDNALTHCYAIVPDGLRGCAGINDWRPADSKAGMEVRTEQIAKLSGVRPRRCGPGTTGETNSQAGSRRTGSHCSREDAKTRRESGDSQFNPDRKLAFAPAAGAGTGSAVARQDREGTQRTQRGRVLQTGYSTWRGLRTSRMGMAASRRWIPAVAGMTSWGATRGASSALRGLCGPWRSLREMAAFPAREASSRKAVAAHSIPG